MLYHIYAGMGGGFGGARYMGTADCKNEEEASRIAYEYAVEEYQQYEGYYGVVDMAEIYENPAEFGIDDEESECFDDEVEAVYQDEVESWIEYYAVPVEEDTDFEEEEEML